MKFCEECGAKLADDAVFCEECGAKQAPVQKETVVEPVVQAEPVMSEQPVAPTPKLSETCTPAKREIKGWLLTLLLIICSPWVLFDIILFLPDALFWILWFVIPIVVLVLMWTKKSWKSWVKWAVTIAYILMFFI